MDTVYDFIELTKAPWGRMFYDLICLQLDIPASPKLKMLDFGSGIGMISNHYAASHDVTAVELRPEMVENRHREYQYTQILGGAEKLPDFDDNTFDIVFCHNVMEYIEEKEPVFAELLRVLKPGGRLSLIKHNRAGRVFHSAVFWNDPGKALELLNNDSNDRSNYFGTQYIYSNENVREWGKKYGGEIKNIFGMRTFYALGQDNSVKYNDEWYQNMLDLENKAAYIDEYKNVAFFNHLIIEKT
ncbi:MAG: methyltransferase domain-containing protein [Clostridiales bacterium]|jgi:ubiquinone/menaquinone biosynthesis C-methylase UbiE|nr:methyltransferase domain-containing protein [Clostridiales bacterium]